MLGNLGDLGKRALASINKSMAEAGIEQYVFDSLRNTMPDDVYKILKEKADLVTLIPDDKITKVRQLAPSIRSFLDEVLTEEYIINRFRQKRPELLHVVLLYPDGLQWLRRQIDLARQLFLT